MYSINITSMHLFLINILDIAGRKSFFDKAEEAIKPNSKKNSLEKAQEKRTDYMDKAAKHVEPRHDKGTLQKISDKISKGKTHHDNNKKYESY